ncbi:MAG: hypothetical protein ACOH1H_10285 [Brevundimonas sp.]
MSDAAIDNALNRRGALAQQINIQQQRLEELRRELSLVDEFIARWHTFAGLEADQPLIPANESVDKSATGKRRPVNPPREVVGDVVEALLKERGEPASRASLFEALPDRGIVIEGADPTMVFSTMLWRMKDRFERIPKRGYWIKGEPIPAKQPATVAEMLE